jgi:hypothetical protein
MAADIEGGWDEQDQSEVFDEDNQSLDEGGSPDAEMRTFEELPEVLDMTSAVGDADDDAALIGEELDDDEIIELESESALADFEDDDLAARMPEALDDDSIDVLDAEEVYLAEEAGLDIRDEADDFIADESSELSMNAGASDEVELEYAGDLDDASVREGKRTAAMESRVLDDEDLDELGYTGEGSQQRPDAER